MQIERDKHSRIVQKVALCKIGNWTVASDFIFWFYMETPESATITVEYNFLPTTLYPRKEKKIFAGNEPRSSWIASNRAI